MSQNKRLPTNKRYKNGFYQCKFPNKYAGSQPYQVIYRSSWELKMMVWCDMNPSVTRWGSELIEIPYTDGGGRWHRYYPDFYIEYEKVPGDVNTSRSCLIEIKPRDQWTAPVLPTGRQLTEGMMRGYRYKIEQWEKNSWKWVYAKKWCDDRAMGFWLLDDNEINNLLKYSNIQHDNQIQ